MDKLNRFAKSRKKTGVLLAVCILCALASRGLLRAQSTPHLRLKAR